MIGKSRHRGDRPTPKRAVNALDDIGQGCGVLRHAAAPGAYRHVRLPAPPDLAPWVDYFWIESWRFPRVAAQKRELLPHPAVHLVFAPGRSRIYGVQLHRFVRELQGSCRIFGVKFHPGVFFPFLKQPVGAIADTFVPAAEIFAGATEIETQILEAGGDRAMVAAASAFLRTHAPAPDAKAELARRAVQEIVDDPALTRVAELAQRIDTPERALQRLFFRYVGASPRWVIKRYRTYEALQRLADQKGIGLSDLAQDLGYFDQAHFTNDFRRLTGQPPASYAGQKRERRAMSR